MYVCVCYGVTDRDIRAAVDNGCTSMRQLSRELNVGRQCGRCASMTRELLVDTLDEQRAMMLAYPA
ncbi:MAG: bacterioferritin-associated ferredoxin [Gammaproteobacteria bacterium]|nr:bacterioferritin-associated ferredoxin [Gammaproteobacteria bacterium]